MLVYSCVCARVLITIYIITYSKSSAIFDFMALAIDNINGYNLSNIVHCKHLPSKTKSNNAVYLGYISSLVMYNWL